MSGMAPEGVRLNEFDKSEWWDVARRLRPELIEAEYDAMWEDFQRMKREHQRQEQLQ